MSLANKILGLKRSGYSTANDPLLDAVSGDIVTRLEKMAAVDSNAARLCKKIEDAVSRYSLGNISSQSALFTAYAEGRLFLALKPRLLTMVLPPAKGRKTPDFSFSVSGVATWYGDVKALHMSDGQPKYRRVLDESLKSKIELEQQLKEGNQIATSEQLVQPHHKASSAYDPYSPRLVIERLIEKFNQNYKSGQFRAGPTVALIYLDANNFPLFGWGRVEDKAIPYYISPDCPCAVPGELWWAAFSRIGGFSFRPPEYEGASAEDGTFMTDGILVAFPDVRAVVFFVDQLGGKLDSVGMFRHGDDEAGVVVREMTGVFNDDRSSETYRLGARPSGFVPRQPIRIPSLLTPIVLALAVALPAIIRCLRRRR